MANSAQQKFIEQIAPFVKKYAKQYGFSCPSAVIAQACLESGYGTSNKAKHHNYFGLKYRKNRVNCNSGYFNDTSKEQLTNGQYIPVSTDWYAFATMEKGVEGYFQFISISNYSNLKGISDPKKYLETIRSDGYATSLSYVDNVYKVVTTNNLVQYDKEEVKNMSLKINSDHPAKSISYGSTRIASSIKYIVIHYTGNKNDTAKNNAVFFSAKGGNIREAGAHYFVDASGIYQSVPDLKVAYAVGGSKYPNTKGGSMHGKITNANSISIEMCSTNGTISDATIANTVLLAKELMSKYKISASNIYRHYDVNGKSCPGWKGWIDSDQSKWVAFKAKLGANVTTSTQPKESTSAPKADTSTTVNYKVKVVSSDGLNCRKEPNASSSKIKTYKDGTTLTITKENNKWGYTGEGWVSLAYTKKVTTQSSTAYYPKYTGKGTTLDTILKGIGVSASNYGSVSKRKKLANANGISNYSGTAAQNTKLIELAKTGKLKKV